MSGGPPVRTTAVLVVFTLVNAAFWSRAVARGDPPAAGDGILRGRGLEIVDDHGRLRMQVVIAPADPAFPMPDGTKGHPETVILRLATADGKPRVKLTTSPTGSGLMLLGDSDATYAILGAQGAKTSLRLRDDASKQKVLEP